MSVRTYRLIVDGELSDAVGGAFDAMVLTRTEGTTTLVGPIEDQAQLLGLIQRVSDLGLTLLSAAETESEQPHLTP